MDKTRTTLFSGIPGSLNVHLLVLVMMVSWPTLVRGQTTASLAGMSPEEEAYVLMDFEDDVLHDERWIRSRPRGPKPLVYVKPKVDSGANVLRLGVGEGRGGGNALVVESRDKSMGLPGFWLLKHRPVGGSVDHVYDDEGYLLPRGRRANRLEFWVRFETGYRARTPLREKPQDNLHVGTYHFDPAGGGPVKESDNWHFYHQLMLRHDRAGDQWIKVSLNAAPQHQRSIKGGPPNNPTLPHGNYWELLTRFYMEGKPEFDDPETGYPCRMWVDDIRLVYEPPSHDVSITIDDLLPGQRVHVAAGDSRILSVRLRNEGSEEVSGVLAPRAPYWLKVAFALAQNGGPVPRVVRLLPGREEQLLMRIAPDQDVKKGRLDTAGILFVPLDTARDALSPVVEQRKFPAAGPAGAPVYGSFVRVRVEPAPENHAPVALGGRLITTERNTIARGQIQASDLDNDELTFRHIDSSETPGRLSLDQHTGRFTFEPPRGFRGVQRFTFQVNDGQSASKPIVLWIRVGDIQRSERGQVGTSKP